jgi:hypothetical protein
MEALSILSFSLLSRDSRDHRKPFTSVARASTALGDRHLAESRFTSPLYCARRVTRQGASSSFHRACIGIALSPCMMLWSPASCCRSPQSIAIAADGTNRGSLAQLPVQLDATHSTTQQARGCNHQISRDGDRPSRAQRVAQARVQPRSSNPAKRSSLTVADRTHREVSYDMLRMQVTTSLTVAQ